MLSHPTFRWVMVGVIILSLVLIPYFLFGAQIETWTEDFLESASEQVGWIALVLALLLAADILLPVPSSLASTAAGLFAGFALGTLVSWVGMTVSCLLGYWLARLGRPLVRRLVGPKELNRLEMMNRRFGMWAVLLICRSVPVLAEASILFVGMNNMPLRQFIPLVVLSNLSISIVYAAVGAFSATANSFLLAFGGSILVLGLVTLVAQFQTREHRHATRRFPRQEVSYTLHNEQGQVKEQGQAWLRNVSRVGLQMETLTSLSPGRRLELDLKLGEKSGALWGTVVRSTPRREGGFEVAVQFEDIPEATLDQLEQYAKRQSGDSE